MATSGLSQKTFPPVGGKPEPCTLREKLHSETLADIAWEHLPHHGDGGRRDEHHEDAREDEQHGETGHSSIVMLRQNRRREQAASSADCLARFRRFRAVLAALVRSATRCRPCRSILLLCNPVSVLIFVE